jgi:DNA-binding NarL/FixJ family response regulator
MVNQTIHVLLVEDNPHDARPIRKLVNETSSTRLIWKSAERLSTAKEILRTEPFDIVLLELLLPDSERLDTLIHLNPYAISLPIVVLTNLDAEWLAIQTVKAGAQDYSIKDEINGKSLMRSIRYAIERKKIETSQGAKNRELAELIAQFSPKPSLISPRDELVFRLVGELNNPLATVSVQLKEAIAQFPVDHPKHGTLQGIQAEIEHLGCLVGSLLQDSLTNVVHAAIHELLSPGEYEVIYLVSKGYANKEIAKQLSVSVRTVERHCSVIMKKLGLQNRAELVAFALQRGILKKGD